VAQKVETVVHVKMLNTFRWHAKDHYTGTNGLETKMDRGSITPFSKLQ